MYSPRSQGARCDGCPRERARPVPAAGNDAKLGTILGRDPGRKETELGEPFRGPSGHLLLTELHRQGLSRGDFFITNRAVCQPAFDENPKSAAEAFSRCENRLWDELAKRPSLPLLVLGKDALGAIDGSLRIDDVRGYVFGRGPRIVMASIHPARVLRQPALRGVFNADIAKWARLVRGEKPALSYDDLPLFVDGWGCLTRILDRCDISGKPVAFDIEADGVDTATCTPTMIAFGDEYEAVSIQDWRSTKFLFESPIRLLGQNVLGFDIPVLSRFGFRARNDADDLRDLRRVLAADSPLSLGYLTSLSELVFPWKQTDYTTDPKGNAMDALMTARVFAKHMKLAEQL